MNYALIIMDYLLQLLEHHDMDGADAICMAKVKLDRFRPQMSETEYIQIFDILNRLDYLGI